LEGCRVPPSHCSSRCAIVVNDISIVAAFGRRDYPMRFEGRFVSR